MLSALPSKSRPQCVNKARLTCGDRITPVQQCKYHGCGGPSSLRRQVISSHDIDYVEDVGHGLTRGRISTTCVMSVWRNAINCRYIFMFATENFARKGCRLPQSLVYGCRSADDRETGQTCTDDLLHHVMHNHLLSLLLLRCYIPIIFTDLK